MLGMCGANHVCMLGMCGDNRVCKLGCVVLTRCAGMEGSGPVCHSSDIVVWVGSAVPPQPYSWSYRGHVCLPHLVCVHLEIKG